jgi:exportin-7
MDPNMLLEIEGLATQLYAGGTSNEARAEAERQLSVLSSNPDMLENVRQILERSALSFAQHLAATAITKQVTTNWGRFSAQQRMDMRNFVLTYLANKGPSVQVK